MSQTIRRTSYSLASEKLSEIKKFDIEDKKRGKIYAKDGCNLLEMDHSDKICKQFFLFAKMLRLMLLRFSPTDGICLRVISHCAMVTMILLSVYVAIYDIYTGIFYCDGKSAPTTLMMVVWYIQAIISIKFLAIWQKDLAFGKFFHQLKHIEIDVDRYEKERNRSIRRNSTRFLVIAIYSLLINLIIGVYAYNGLEKDLLNPMYKYVFYYPELRYIRIFQVYYNMLSWNVGVHTYTCLTNAMYWEVKKYNWKLREIPPSDEESMSSYLIQMIKNHSSLNKGIRELDRIFTVYAFLMIAIIIPTLLFTLLTLFTRTNIMDVMFSISPVFFCLYAFYAVTMTPARLHEELFKSKSFLFMNDNVWVPYSKKVNKIGRTLAMHLDQTDLGISIWGFAMVTKPLILTTFSVMMTCLALLLEFKPGKGMLSDIGNSTDLR